MALTLSSPAFQDGEMIPVPYTCDGKDVSPELSWSGAPKDTKSFALVCEDPDAPGGTWTHWVIYDIPVSVTRLPMGVPPTRELAEGAKQGMNDFHRIGYGGPCPPKGPAHHYYFTLYALDATLQVSPGITREVLLRAMEGHILEEAKLMGRYQR